MKRERERREDLGMGKGGYGSEKVTKWKREVENKRKGKKSEEGKSWEREQSA